MSDLYNTHRLRLAKLFETVRQAVSQKTLMGRNRFWLIAW
jgi:hypothetical protein